jgi:hypothetical protein
MDFITLEYQLLKKEANVLEVRKGTAGFKLYKFKQSLLSGSELEMVKEERR